jgi:small GTP-binding protein
MSQSFSSRTYKIVVVGCSAVGKSSIVQRLVQDTFNEDATSTCGADFYSYSIPVGNETVKLQNWNTAGQERFHSISKSYFRNAVGGVLVYDITNSSTFDRLSDWLNELQALAAPNAYILLVGNKADLEKKVRSEAMPYGTSRSATIRNDRNIGTEWEKRARGVRKAIPRGVKQGWKWNYRRKRAAGKRMTRFTIGGGRRKEAQRRLLRMKDVKVVEND